MAEISYVTRGKGEYVASESHLGVFGRSVRPGVKRGIISIGGYGLTVTAGSYDASPYTDSTQQYLRAGLPLIYGDISDGGQWGSATAVSRIASLFTFAQSRLGFKTDKVLLACGSMGTTNAFNYARANPTKVAALGLSLPVVDAKDIYDNDRGGYASAVAAALPTDQDRIDHSAVNWADELDGIPILLFASTDDPICNFARVQAFVAACSTCTLVDMGAQGHSVPAGVYDDQASEFLSQYA